jgi:hypothetical protein
VNIDSRHQGHTRRGWFSIAKRGLWSLLAGTGLTLRSLSQDIDSKLVGSVMDPIGAGVARALVRIINNQTGLEISTTTTSDGVYGFAGLPPGKYDIIVESSGFVPAKLHDVSLAVGQVTTVDVNLGVGAAAIEVEQSRITGRQFLVGEAHEEPGYGLYSYVLLGSPPTDATRERVIALMREYLAFPDTVQLKKSVPKGQLNVTYLPLARKPSIVEPNSILKAYNYARAQALLAKVPMGPHVDGPYIISSQFPLTDSEMLSGYYLYQDLSPIPSTIIVLWVREFMKQSAKKDFWRKRDGPQAALKLRTAIATLAIGVDPARKSVNEWQGMLTQLLSWKPETSANPDQR